MDLSIIDIHLKIIPNYIVLLFDILVCILLDNNDAIIQFDVVSAKQKSVTHKSAYTKLKPFLEFSLKDKTCTLE